MPRHRPPTSGYARISQADEERGFLDDSDEDDVHRVPQTISSASAPRYAPIQPQPHGPMHSETGEAPPRHQRRLSFSGRRRPRRSSSGVDIKAINLRLERWADEIASKFKIKRVKGKTEEEEQLEIKHSVFQAPEGIRPMSTENLAIEEDIGDRMTKIGFDDIVESVKVAIELGVHPKMISQGSSGSYFARNSDGKVVGVFKPKDEEPYASRNPKWTKWIHRNLFPCFFGRACLIPNLSYVSEAAAYTLDQRLRTNIVPYTDIVYLSSKSFHYDFWERSNYYRRRKPLPAKVGSFQVFLKGFKDANIFLRDNPWPDQNSSSLRPEDTSGWRRKPWRGTCPPGSRALDEEEAEEEGAETEAERQNEAGSMHGPESANTHEEGFKWSGRIKQLFREELEKLVVLDYIMRNTDRGLDNWMVRIDEENQAVSIVAEPSRSNIEAEGGDTPAVPIKANSGASRKSSPYKQQEGMTASNRSQISGGLEKGSSKSISLGAIDNSLSWPWKHPDAWRSFPFGWLFLPVSLIGQPFSQKTRDHFLPLLTSTQWWSGTQLALRKVFSQDSDFKERMFARQIAVMKGQAWNVVETLKTIDHGPLELTRRPRVCVWDDLVDIPVALPMHRPSTEMRRRRQREMEQGVEQEEMDISAANASESVPQPDLLRFDSPTDLPNPNRFNISRNNSSSDLGFIADEAQTHNAANGSFFDDNNDLEDAKIIHANNTRPTATRSKTRISIETPGGRQTMGGTRPRRSYSAKFSSVGSIGDVDELEGDLGYSAAEGMENSRRKVIVERLETVKSKNPVFTWC